jgi:hypothetical protein
VRRRTGLLGVLLVCALAGCSGGGEPDVAASKAQGWATAEAPPTSPVPESAVPSGPAKPAGAKCTAADLVVVLGRAEDGSTHHSRVLLFRNVQDVPCSVQGYPAVTMVDSAGKTVTAKTTPSGYLGGVRGGELPVVIVPVSGTASALLEATATGNGCAHYTAIMASLPGDPNPQRAAWNTDACAEPEVHPFVAGLTGSQA